MSASVVNHQKSAPVPQVEASSEPSSASETEIGSDGELINVNVINEYGYATAVLNYHE